MCMINKSHQLHIFTDKELLFSKKKFQNHKLVNPFYDQEHFLLYLCKSPVPNNKNKEMLCAFVIYVSFLIQ